MFPWTEFYYQHLAFHHCRAAFLSIPLLWSLLLKQFSIFSHFPEQGSLTIVRRTNSRKNTHILQQQQLQHQQELLESDPDQEGDYSQQQQQQTLSESELAFVNSQLSRELESMQPTAGSGSGSPPSSAVVQRSDTLTGDELENVDLATDNLPAVDTPDACDKAALR